MLTAMRQSTKWVMWVVIVAMVGWLVFQVGMGLTGRNTSQSSNIGSVNGKTITY